MTALDNDSRLLLLRFACTMAWADFELHPQERKAVFGLVERLGLDEAAKKEATEWLRCPPPPDDVDPQTVPEEARALFYAECEGIAQADGVVRPEEREALDLLRQILRLDG